MSVSAKIFRIPVFLFFAIFPSCGLEEPEGMFKGHIEDWVNEVFDGTLTSAGQSSEIRLDLGQSPVGMVSKLIFRQPGKEEVVRMGEWEIGDRERVIRFSDEKEPSEFFLIKRGARFAFQTKDGGSNDDGSPILLMRNEGLSRKGSYPFSITFKKERQVLVRAGGNSMDMPGEWSWASGRIAAVVNLPAEESADEKDSHMESYKIFLAWSEDDPGSLELEKMVVLRPFIKKDGTKRQSWMSSLRFPDRPRLKPN